MRAGARNEKRPRKAAWSIVPAACGSVALVPLPLLAGSRTCAYVCRRGTRMPSTRCVCETHAATARRPVAVAGGRSGVGGGLSFLDELKLKSGRRIGNAVPRRVKACFC